MLAEMTMFVLFTVVIGVVIFGGVTLVYLRDARASRADVVPALLTREDGSRDAAASQDRAA